MAILRAQVEINSVAGMPKDVVMNRFHFRTPTTPASGAEVTQVVDRVANFYQGLLSNARVLYSRYPQVVSASGHVIKVYDMDDPVPRQPLTVFPMVTFPVAPAQTGFPDEVALVLSFQGAKVSGVPQARRRNRIYFGPVTTASAVVTSNENRPSAGIIDDLIKAADEKLAIATLGVEWIVRSETTGVVTPVTDGWVDNAWDTQRRRGSAPSARTVFTA